MFHGVCVLCAKATADFNHSMCVHQMFLQLLFLSLVIIVSEVVPVEVKKRNQTTQKSGDLGCAGPGQARSGVGTLIALM